MARTTQNACLDNLNRKFDGLHGLDNASMEQKSIPNPLGDRRSLVHY